MRISNGWFGMFVAGIVGVVGATAQGTPIAVNVVATNYHSPSDNSSCPTLHASPFGNETYDRTLAFADVTDSSTITQFDTWNSGAEYTSAGLVYDTAGMFQSISLTKGQNAGDGGWFTAAPSLYLLTTNTDPNRTDPISTGSGYAIVNVAASGAWNNPGDVCTFDLSGLSASERTGYGFAIRGPVYLADDGARFIEVAGLSATFASVPEPSAIVVLITGMFGLLAYAWRKQK